MKTLQDMGVPKASHIVTGFKGWKEAGFPVEPYQPKKPPPSGSGEKSG